jgi:nitroreductase
MKISRKHFIKLGLTGIFASSAIGLINSCAGMKRKDLRDNDFGSMNSAGLEKNEFHILSLASLAPSGHNMQPWFVRRLKPYDYVIGIDKSRLLPAIDPENRETLLSIGAFSENLSSAALSLGFVSEILVTGKTSFDDEILKIKLVKSRPNDFPVNSIITRRTVKHGQLPKDLKNDDVSRLLKTWPGHIFYFPRNASHTKCLTDWTIESNTFQTWKDDAQRELANCIRFSNDDVLKYKCGLTVNGMEITGIAGWYVKNFMNSEDVLGNTFRKSGIDLYAKMANEGAGWLIITSDGDKIEHLIEAGRRFQRMALQVRDLNIGIHPMTQILEEKKWREQIPIQHNSELIPQFILRAGYLNTYPDPVSPRRPVNWFLHS